MSKSIKLKDNNYIDSSGIVHNKKTLKEILDTTTLYSGEEQVVGTWHNGKNVYRKVLFINLSNFSGGQEYSIKYADYGIAGTIIVHRYSGVIERNDGIWQVIPCTLENWHIDIFDFAIDNFKINVSKNQASVGVTILTLVLEYEKC